MLHCEARLEARRDAQGNFVPLREQDTRLWSRTLATEAERELGRAARLSRIGPFQLEAAIQSVHCGRAATGYTNWTALAQLYETLVHLAPTIGRLVSHAAAIAEARGAEEGLVLLDRLREGDVNAYQPFWALRAHLLARADRSDEAALAYDRAMGLSDDPAVRAFLLQRRNRATL
jgi:RNA polymerase sigma-70 factor (ECF subfamily)